MNQAERIEPLEYFKAPIRFFKDIEGFGFLIGDDSDIFFHWSDQSQEIISILRLAERDTHEFTYYLVENPYRIGTTKAIITDWRELSTEEIKAVQENQKINTNLTILKKYDDTSSINNIGTKFKEVLEEVKENLPKVTPENVIEKAMPTIEKLQSGIEHIKGFNNVLDILPDAFYELEQVLDRLADFENDSRHSKELLEWTDEQLLAQAKEEQKAYRFRRDVKNLYITYEKLVEIINSKGIDKEKMRKFKIYLTENETKTKDKKYYMRTIDEALTKQY